jgi:hypothetical protein
MAVIYEKEKLFRIKAVIFFPLETGIKPFNLGA